MITKRVRLTIAICQVLALTFSVGRARQQQKLDKFKVEEGIRILDVVHDEVKKHYYDPNFHGVNIDQAFAQAREKIRNVDSLNRSFGIIADALDTLQDSHKYFIPPPRPYSIEYGFRHEMVGNNCFVIAVRSDSDAGRQGLRPGDQILSINEHPIDVVSQWKLEYLYNILSPQPGLVLNVQSPNGSQRRLQIEAEIVHFNKTVSPGQILSHAELERRLEKPRTKDFGDDLIIVNLPTFDISPVDLESIIGKIRKHKAVILDMRGNPGGLESAMLELLTHLFDHEVHVGDRVTKGGRKSLDIKGSGDHAYSGKIVALVDSQSASAAELVARVLQIEKRATVIGDHSSGKVMEAKFYGDQLGLDTLFGFGVAVTEADLIMSDGKSLEKNGVTPDEVLLPTAADLERGRDPVISRASAILGVTVSPEDAGQFFPHLWVKSEN